jgi:hypothetical protein
MDGEIQGLIAQLAALALARSESPEAPTATTAAAAPGSIQAQLRTAYDEALGLADRGELPAARALLLAILDDDPAFEAAAELLASLSDA